MRVRFVWLLSGLLCLAGMGIAQEALRSGPQPAAKGQRPVKVPASFEAHTFNGRHPDRFHCLVCENDFFPTVLMFLKEPAEGKDAAIKALFVKLEGMVDKYAVLNQYPEVASFSVYAVFLSEAAQTSLTKPDEKDPAGLVKEATARRALYLRMREWAKPLKKVTIAAAIPEAVQAYQLNPAAELTGIYYDAFNVLENFAFAEGAFKEEDIEPIVARVERQLQGKIAVLESGRKNKLGGIK